MKTKGPVGREIRILTLSTIYPNAMQPLSGIPVETRLRQLVDTGSVQARVLAPVPWFPWTTNAFGRYAVVASVPREESRFGIQVSHPRYPVIPKIGATVAPALLYLSLRPVIAHMIRCGYGFDLIDAHHLYPGGVAAVMLGQYFRKPVVVTARGSDVNVMPRYAAPRHLIQWAISRTAGLIAVSRALKEKLVELGADANVVRVLRNGVDLERFRPLDPNSTRARLNLRSPVLLSVGELLPNKGHDLIVRALTSLPNAYLVIAGHGSQEARLALQQLADGLGLSDRVRVLGPIPNEELAGIYSAADILVLASASEGWPNVLLEAMACGTPVAAMDVGGVPEIIADPAAGRLIRSREPDAIADTIRAMLTALPNREHTRAYAEQFTWRDTSEGQVDLFRSVLGNEQK